MREIQQNIVDAVAEGFVVCDGQGLVVMTNRALRERLRLKGEDLLGRPLVSLVAADSRTKLAMLMAAATAQPSAVTDLDFIGGGNDYTVLPVQFFRRGGYLYLRADEATGRLDRLKEKLDRQIANAIRIHRRSLPDSLPNTPTISFAAHYAAADDLGGDLYAVFKVDHDLLDDLFEQYVCFLTDVSGHGLDSAMLSIFVRETINGYFKLRHQPAQLVSPKEIMDFFVEQYLREEFPADFFVCIFLAVFDLRNQELTYCSAGFQTAPMVADSQGGLSRLHCGGLPVSSALPAGILQFKEHSLPLAPGMTILFSTDGLPDQRLGDEVYAPRLEKIFAAGHRSNPAAMVAAITDELSTFLQDGPIDDDVTVVVAQIPTSEAGGDG